jgi:cell division protein FtsB
MYGRYNEAAVARAGAEAQVKDLKQREADLTAMTKRLSTDRGMEEELRHRYGVAKEGEGVIDIVAATNTTPVTTPKGGVIEWLKRLF